MWDAKEPTPMFEKSRGRRPRWCGQPLRVVGLGRDAPCMGPMSSVRAHFLWAGLCTEKLIKKKKEKKKETERMVSHPHPRRLKCLGQNKGSTSSSKQSKKATLQINGNMIYQN